MIAVLLTGLPGALLPARAFEKLSWLVGHGKPPLVPLTIYLSGNAGFAYVTIAVLLWAIQRDLPRYPTLVRTFGWMMLIGCPAYLSIGMQCKLPLWWALIDSLSCLAVGIILMWACPKPAKTA